MNVYASDPAGPQLLKREIRILGLSAPTKIGKEIVVVGVVFRGSLWLDGAFISVLRPKEPDRVLAHAIKNCKQYSQLHAVLLTKDASIPSNRINIRKLSHSIGLPIISIHRNRQRKTRNAFQISAPGRPILASVVGMTPKQTKQILAVSCAGRKRIPEALRVAEIIATGLSKLRFQPEENQKSEKSPAFFP